MFPFILKATIAGLIAASIPLMAKHFGPQLAGIVVLVPATTVMAFIYLWGASGHQAVGAAAVGGLKGLLPLALFLVAAASLAPRLTMVPTLALALAVWVVAVVTLKYAGVIPSASVLAVVTAVKAWAHRPVVVGDEPEPVHYLRPKPVYLPTFRSLS